MKLTSTFTKRVLAIALSAGMVLAYAGMSAPTYAKTKTVKPTKITLKAAAKTIDVKAKTTVSIKKIKPAKASKKVTWKSSNSKIATVTKKGVVKGKKNGTVTITAKSTVSKKVKGTIKITVKDVAPTTLTLNNDGYLSINKATTLTAALGADGVYNAGLTWTSGDPAIATVDAKGVVTPVSNGKVVITVASKEVPTLTDTVTVTTGMQGISAAEVKSIIDNKTAGYVLIDVRTASDFSKLSHPDTAVNADMDKSVSDADALASIKTITANQPAGTKYVVLCYSGNSYARRGYGLLKQAGVDEANIFNLAGGYVALNPLMGWTATA